MPSGVIVNKDARKNKLNNLDKTRSNNALSTCWIENGYPNLYASKNGRFKLSFIITPQDQFNQCSEIDDTFNQYYQYLDSDKNVIKNIDMDTFKEEKNELNDIIFLGNDQELSPRHADCYHLTMALLYKILDKDLMKGQKHYEYYTDKKINQGGKVIDLGYDLEKSVAEEWLDFYKYSQSPETSYQAELILNKIMKKYSKTPNEVFADYRLSEMNLSQEYSNYNYLTQVIEVSKNLNDVFYAKKRDLKKIRPKKVKERFYNLSSYYIKKINSRAIENELGEKYKAEEDKIINIEDDFWNLVLDNLRIGYGEGYPVSIQNSDALLINNQDKVKIIYQHNKNHIDIPYSLSLKSNNMYYKNVQDSKGNWNEDYKQEYVIYHSNDLNSYNAYNLYAGGRYLLLPNIHKDRQNKITQLQKYTFLFLGTTALKAYLTNR